MVVMVAIAGDAFGQGQTVYRYTDADGRIVYSDHPPVNARDVEAKRLTPNYIEIDQTTLATQKAQDRFPVTLYTFACGDVCDRAEALGLSPSPNPLRRPQPEVRHHSPIVTRPPEGTPLLSRRTTNGRAPFRGSVFVVEFDGVAPHPTSEGLLFGTELDAGCGGGGSDEFRVDAHGLWSEPYPRANSSGPRVGGHRLLAHCELAVGERLQRSVFCGREDRLVL